MPRHRAHHRTPASVAVIAGGWAAFAISVAAYVYISAQVLHQPFHVGLRHLRYFDLRVYRAAAERVLHGRGLYSRPIVRHLGFTYPPVAALLLVPLTLASLRADELAVTAINLAALVWLLRRAIAIPRPSARATSRTLSHPATAWALAAAAAGAALWLEPVTVALGYGQVDLLIALLVVFDLSRSDHALSKGAAIGLAAGIKLTPLLFIPYLLLSGRRRAAAVATAVFAATIAVSFALARGDAERYWGGLVLRTSRVGGAIYIANQSLRGALARFTGVLHPGVGVTIVIVLVAAGGLALAIRASRRGDEATGFSLCAITALLASPVSWTHHWVLAVPALFLLVLAGYERASLPMLLLAAAITLVGYAYLPERHMGRHPSVTDDQNLLAVDPYVMIGLLALAGAAATAVRSALRQAPARRYRRRRRRALSLTEPT